MNLGLTCVDQGAYQIYWGLLGPDVLVVAAVNVPVGDWAAYIGALPFPLDHNADCWRPIRDHGSKVDPALAAFLFPEIADKFRWRA